MTRGRDTGEIPNLVLERYWLGELPPAEAQALARRLDAESDLAARLEALQRSDEEIRGRYPPGWLAEQIRLRRGRKVAQASPRPRAWLLRWPVPTALAVAATLALALAPRLLGPPSRGPVASDDRIKGLEPSLLVFRKADAGSQTLADGSIARAGDVVRLGYRAAGRTHGVILSVDGRGVVTVHLPTRGRQAAQLRTGETVLLDRASELDAAPGFERFYLVTAEHAFEVQPIIEAARRTAREPGSGELPLTAPLSQTTFLLRKGGRP
jgi:hypothetical protein